MLRVHVHDEFKLPRYSSYQVSQATARHVRPKETYSCTVQLARSRGV